MSKSSQEGPFPLFLFPGCILGSRWQYCGSLSAAANHHNECRKLTKQSHHDADRFFFSFFSRRACASMVAEAATLDKKIDPPPARHRDAGPWGHTKKKAESDMRYHPWQRGRGIHACGVFPR